MQWCKALGYDYNDTNSTGFKTRQAQPGYLLQSAYRPCRTASCYNTASHAVKSAPYSPSTAIQVYSGWYSVFPNFNMFSSNSINLK